MSVKEVIPFCKEGKFLYVTGIYITSFGVISILDFCDSIRYVVISSCLYLPCPDDI